MIIYMKKVSKISCKAEIEKYYGYLKMGVSYYNYDISRSRVKVTKKISISFTLRRQEIVVMSTTIEALPSTGIDIFDWIFGDTS